MFWTPLLGCTLASLGITALPLIRADDVPAMIGTSFGAASAAAACAALGDPARLLLDPIPATALRLFRRVALAGVGLAIVLALLNPWTSSAIAVPGAFALFAAGVALHAVVEPRTDHAGELAALATFGWFASASMIPERVVPHIVTSAWHDHPWSVVFAAVLIATLYARERRWRMHARSLRRQRSGRVAGAMSG